MVHFSLGRRRRQPEDDGEVDLEAQHKDKMRSKKKNRGGGRKEEDQVSSKEE